MICKSAPRVSQKHNIDEFGKAIFVAKKVSTSLNYVSLILLELVDLQLCRNVRWKQLSYLEMEPSLLNENNSAFNVLSFSVQIKIWLSYLLYIMYF